MSEGKRGCFEDQNAVKGAIKGREGEGEELRSKGETFRDPKRWISVSDE